MAETPTVALKCQTSKPEGVCQAEQWAAGAKFAFVQKETGVLLIGVPKRDDLAGLARGDDTGLWRDRNDRT